MKNKMVVLGLCAVVGSLFSSVVPERQDPAPKDGIRDFVVTTDRADDFSSAEVKVAGDGTAKLYDAAFQEVPLKLDRPRTGRGQLRPGADEEVCFPRTVRDLGVRFESVETFRRWHCHTQSATDSICAGPCVKTALGFNKKNRTHKTVTDCVQVVFLIEWRQMDTVLFITDLHVRAEIPLSRRLAEKRFLAATGKTLREWRKEARHDS